MTPIQPNGTDAKDITLHFIKVTEGRATPAIMRKTINQVKSILASGYTKQEIINVIDYLIEKKNIQMYSIGYVSTSINSVLKEAMQYAEIKKAKEEIASANETKQKEVITDGESAERNRNKARRFGVQSRFGKEFNFDMFEGN